MNTTIIASTTAAGEIICNCALPEAVLYEGHATFAMVATTLAMTMALIFGFVKVAAK